MASRALPGLAADTPNGPTPRPGIPLLPIDGTRVIDSFINVPPRSLAPASQHAKASSIPIFAHEA